MIGFDIKRLTPLIYVTSVLILLLVTFRLMVFLLPFLIATIIVSITNPVARFISEKTKMKKNIAKLLTLTLFYILLLFIFIIIIFNITIEVVKFSSELGQNSKTILDAISNIPNEINSYIKFLPSYTITYINIASTKLVNYFTNYIFVLINSSINIVKQIPSMSVYIVITVLSSYIILFEKKEIINFFEKQMPKSWIDTFFKIKKDVLSMLFVYIKTQLMLITICFFELLIGFSIINLYTSKLEYILIFALLTSVVDALPILGTGTVLIPYSMVQILLNKEYILGISIIVLYVIITLIRQYIEPKLISTKAGVHPLLTLVALYSGYRIFGIIGFLYGPIILVIIRIVFIKEIEYGFFKYLINEKSEGHSEKNI